MKVWLWSRLSPLGVAMLFLITMGANAPINETVQVPVNSLVAAIDNRDVQWHGENLGLRPELRGASLLVATYCDEKAIESLASSLDDPMKCVAVHVLLVKILRVEVEVSASHWDDVAITINADGGVQVEPMQKEKLKAKWERRIRKARKLNH